MRKDSWIPLFCTCLLLPAAAKADDTFDRLYESRWQLSHTLDTTTYLGELPEPTTSLDLDVDDGNTILRVTKIRSLSLLTLSGDERSKWFLGINEDGFVGLHFRGFSRNGAKRHLDLASLISAKDDAEDDETD
ncbi:MAG: hypothetical protein ACR2QX_03815 [Woeseiaceae bacterium]